MNLFPSSQADVLACRGDLRRRALAAREALVPAAREALTQRVIGHLEILLATVSPRVFRIDTPRSSSGCTNAVRADSSRSCEMMLKNRCERSKTPTVLEMSLERLMSASRESRWKRACSRPCHATTTSQKASSTK